MRAERVLELNPRHPLVVHLALLQQEDEGSEFTKDWANLLVDMAALSSGVPIAGDERLVHRVFDFMQLAGGDAPGLVRELEDDRELVELINPDVLDDEDEADAAEGHGWSGDPDSLDDLNLDYFEELDDFNISIAGAKSSGGQNIYDERGNLRDDVLMIDPSDAAKTRKALFKHMPPEKAQEMYDALFNADGKPKGSEGIGDDAPPDTGADTDSHDDL